MSGSKNQSPSLNMISEGTSLKGIVNTQNDIRIAGKCDGEVISKGKLIVTSSGVIDGSVKALDSDIAGKVEGELRISNKLILRQSAVIDGDIYTKTLIVEEGAEMNGACHMGSEASSAKKPSGSASPSKYADSATSSKSALNKSESTK